MQVRVLGAIEAVDGELAVDLGRPRQRELLAMLAVRPGEVVPEDRLVSELWLDDESMPDNPRRSLQTYVSRLRGVVGAENLLTRASGYLLELETDAQAFEAAIIAASGDSSRLASALELWTGSPFAEFAGRSWALAEGRRLTELYRSGLERLAEARIIAGQEADAASSLQALVVEEPLRAEAVRLLMLALHRAGRQAEALRAFQDHREALAASGLEPGDEIADLERRILQQDPDLDGPLARRLGSYELGEKIGEGAFGEIYRAIQPSVGREVAVKVIRPELANDREFVRCFDIEAHTVARLEHPHIVPLYDYWRDPSGAYLVMRYLTGGSAATRLVRGGPWPLADVARLVDEIGAALAIAHDAGVVHRDVKPENILFDEVGNSYLADFGIAADTGRSEADLRSAGSPLYVSPEQVRDGESSATSDIYAFGVVLYELLTGLTPFGDSDSVAALLERKLAERVPSLTADRPDVPSGVDLVIQTATATEPGQRFPTMGDLVLAFRAATAGAIEAGTTTSSGARPRDQAIQTLISLELETTNPYKGLSAFEETDAGDFHGRSALVEELVQRVGQSRFTIVTGPSGSGKSSVVRAGLLPRLRDSGAYMASIIPGAHPMDELETALLRIATGPTGALLEQLTSDERGLGRAVKTTLPDDDTELILVIDQFEELFTLTPEASRDQFLAAVAHAVSDERSQLRVVATLRADFYDRPLQHPAVSDLVKVNTVAVSPMSGEELDAAITAPAARVGVTVEPALVAELVGEVRGHPAALPMLQYALTELYEARVSGRMTIEAYRELGGITGALANRADEIHDGLQAEQQGHARRLFTRLITPGEGTEDTRRRVPLGELSSVDSDVIEAYGVARLLTFDNDPATREPTVEVAHEAIIREWPRLRAWLDADRDGLRIHRHLGTSAQAWQASGRDGGELYRSGRLDAANEWADVHGEDLNFLEREFLDSSVQFRQAEEAAEAERYDQQVRSNRRLRGLLAGVAVLLAVALIASGVAFQQRGRANDARRDAEANAREAVDQAGLAEIASERAQEQTVLAEEQAALAETERSDALEARFDSETRRLQAETAGLSLIDPRLGARVAAEAYRRDSSPGSLSALQRVFLSSPGLIATYGGGTEYTGAFFLAAERILAVHREGLQVIEMESGGVVYEWPIADINDLNNVTDRFTTKLAVVDTSPDGLAVVGLRSGGVVIVDTGTGQEVKRFPGDSRTDGVALSADGRLVAWIDESGRLYVREIVTGVVLSDFMAKPYSILSEMELPDPLSTTPEAALFPVVVRNVLFNDDASQVIVGDALSVTVWDVSTGEQVSRLFAGREASFVPTGVFPIVNRTISIRDGMIQSAGSTHLVEFDLATGVAATRSYTGVGALLGTQLAVPVGDDSVVAITDSAQLILIDAETAEAEATIITGARNINALRGREDGSEVLVASNDGVMRFVLDGSGPLHRSVPASDFNGGATLNRDGSLLLAGFGFVTATQGELTMWDLSERVPRPDILDIDPVQDAFFGFDGEDIELFHLDRGSQVIDYPSLQPLGPVIPTQGHSTSYISPDRSLRSIAHSPTDDLWIYDVASGDLVAQLSGLGRGENRGVASHSFDPGWTKVAAVHSDGSSMVWSTDTWEPIGTLQLDGATPTAVSFSISGNYLAVIDDEASIHILDAETMQESGPLLVGLGATGFFSRVEFSSDDKYVLTTADGVGRLWDRASGIVIGDAFPNDASFFPAETAADGSLRMVTRTDDHIRVWTLEPDNWATLACEMAGRSMTAEEWEQFGPKGDPYVDTCERLQGDR